jgi:hypothetical protein
MLSFFCLIAAALRTVMGNSGAQLIAHLVNPIRTPKTVPYSFSASIPSCRLAWRDFLLLPASLFLIRCMLACNPGRPVLDETLLFIMRSVPGCLLGVES